MVRRGTFRLASVVSAALFWVTIAPPGSAADGVLEINQACAENTGCFAGDTPGFPVEIQRTGSYRLTSNLSTPGAGLTAISILADSVTLDLAGFAVGFCLDPPPGVACLVLGVADGIEGSGVNDVTLRNGIVAGFTGRGVDLGRRARVEGVTIKANGGAGLRVLQNSLVESNRIAFNGGTGVSMGAGTAWGNNVLTTNNPDFSGDAVAVTHNLCSGRICGRVLERRYYLSSIETNELQSSTACANGFKVASPLELTNPASLSYDSARGETLEAVGDGTLGWVEQSPSFCAATRWFSGAWETSVTACFSLQKVWCIEEK